MYILGESGGLNKWANNPCNPYRNPNYPCPFFTYLLSPSDQVIHDPKGPSTPPSYASPKPVLQLLIQQCEMYIIGHMDASSRFEVAVGRLQVSHLLLGTATLSELAEFQHATHNRCSHTCNQLYSRRFGLYIYIYDNNNNNDLL